MTPKVQPTEDYLTDDVKMKSKVEPSAEYCSSVAADPKITRHWFATLAGNNGMSLFLLS